MKTQNAELLDQYEDIDPIDNDQENEDDQHEIAIDSSGPDPDPEDDDLDPTEVYDDEDDELLDEDDE